jgi:curved DNA-binding protein CbpA
MAEADYYHVLGVPPSATSKQIKSAYRRLVKKYHPDLFATPDEKARATAVFHRINHAYAVLGDPKRRSFYDQLRAQKPVDAEPRPAAQPGSRSARRKKMAVGRPMLLWRAVRQNIARLRIRAANFVSVNRIAVLVTKSVNQLYKRVSPNVLRRPSRWKAAFIFGSIVAVWILMS